MDTRNMHPVVREGLGALARLGARAGRAMVSSALEDVGDLAELFAKKLKTAQHNLDERDRRRRRGDE
jgi:hypothetical protein